MMVSLVCDGKGVQLCSRDDHIERVKSSGKGRKTESRERLHDSSMDELKGEGFISFSHRKKK